RALRDGDQPAGRGHRARLEPDAERSRRAALPVRGAVLAAADRSSPLADPGILVVEDEGNAELALQPRTEERRIDGIQRDEQQVVPLARQQRPASMAKTGKR